MISTSPLMADLAAAPCPRQEFTSQDQPLVPAAHCRINILGFTGSGAALLALALAEALDTTVLDSDMLAWRPTQPLFQIPNSRRARRDRLLSQFTQHPRVIVCGFVAGWDHALESLFDLVVLLTPSRKVVEQPSRASGLVNARTESLRQRRQDRWLQACACPVFRLDSALSTPKRVEHVLEFFRDECHRPRPAIVRSHPTLPVPPMNSPQFPCSGYVTVGGVVFFARMLHKIRLHAAGLLPADYNLGKGSDSRMCRFLGVDYAAVDEKARAEQDDAVVLESCFRQGRRPSEDDVLFFNAFMTKRGWRDDYSAKLAESKAKRGWAQRDDIQTGFDLQDAEEGRK